MGEGGRLHLPSGVLAVLVAVAVLVAAGSPVMGHQPWAVRLMALAADAMVALFLVRSLRPLLLLSPLFLLGTSAVLFYSVAVALGPGLLLKPNETLWFFATYLGSRGEGLVLQFAAVALACTVALAFLVPAERPGDEAPGPGVRWLAAATVALAVGNWVMVAGPGPAEGPVVKTLHDAALPALSALVALFAERASRLGGRSAWLFAAVATVVAGLLFAGGDAKTAAFIASASCGLYLVGAARRLGGLRVVWAGLVVVLAVAGGLSVVTMARYGPLRDTPDTPAATGLDRLASMPRTMLVSKVLWRQGETGACFQNVVARHLDGGSGETPFYFVSAVVPRVLWPAKPSLSNGRAIGIAYCRQPVDTIHDASVLLLGEPLIKAGPLGLAVAGGVLVLLLGGVTVATARGGAMGAVTLAALLPWMVDFDQNFALYLANAVKMGMTAGLVLVAVHWVRKKAG